MNSAVIIRLRQDESRASSTGNWQLATGNWQPATGNRFIQLGLIAQGIMLALATTVPHLVWAHFGSWFRTIRNGICPSEAAVAIALRNTLPHFLADSSPASDLAKFIQQRLDFTQNKAGRLAA